MENGQNIADDKQGRLMKTLTKYPDFYYGSKHNGFVFSNPPGLRFLDMNIDSTPMTLQDMPLRAYVKRASLGQIHLSAYPQHSQKVILRQSAFNLNPYFKNKFTVFLFVLSLKFDGHI